MNEERRVKAARELLEIILPDENWDSDHLENTPKRFAQMLHDLTHSEEFEFTTFVNDMQIDEMVVVRNIPFWTLCAHHIIPFYGMCHIAYLPENKIAGLSKFPRTVKWASKGLWVQEDLTSLIAQVIDENLKPKGLAVVMEGEHLCMTMRGVQTPGTITTTSVMQGVFLDPSKHARQEFLALIRDRGM